MTTAATLAPPTMAGVDILATEYLLDGLPRIPRGDVTLVFGDGAIGKGRLIWSWIAEVINTDPAAVVIGVWPEDHPNEQVAPRLRDAGVSDPARVVNLTRLPGGSRFKLSADLTHEGHLGLLRQYISDLEADGKLQVRMIVMDPLASVVGWGSIQSNSGARRLVEPLQDLSMDTGIATVVVAHTVTGGKLQGSMGLSQAARLVYRVSADPVNRAIRVIHAEKANNLPETEDLRFVIEGDDDGHVRARMIDGAEADLRRRQWRAPQPSGQLASHVLASPAVTSLAAQRARHAMVAGILSIACPDCSRPNSCGCDLRYPGAIIPLSISPPLGAHESRILAAALAGHVDLDEVMAAVAAALS